MLVGAGAGVMAELSVAMGTTDSEVMVSQGVLLAAGVWGTSTEVVEGVGAWVASTDSGASELVATGITVSEVMVSQGVDEAGLDEGEAGTGITGTVLGPAEGWGAGLEERGAGLEGTTTLTDEAVPVAWTTVV